MPFRLENWPAAPRCAAYLAVFCAQVPCRTAPQQSVRPWLKAQFACRKGHASNHHAEATAFSPLVCPRVPYRRKQKCDLPSRSVERAQGYAGIISDVQYADIPDGASFSGIPRYYRTSLAILRSAVSGWRDAGVDFCVHLGDIVDGFNPRELAEGALDLVVGEFEKLEKPHYHMIGNHCLYNIPRKVILLLGTMPPLQSGLVQMQSRLVTAGTESQAAHDRTRRARWRQLLQLLPAFQLAICGARRLRSISARLA